MNVYFVHGFLGQPEDWRGVEEVLKTRLPTHTHFYSMNLWRNLKDLSTERMFQTWAENFAEQLEGEDNWLIGYSLGGRLLLHLPAEVFPRVKAVSLIASHWGLEDPDERDERLKNDQRWAERFLKDSWNKVTTDWNAQSVFQNDGVRPLRIETHYTRALLAQALDGWSLGRQKSFWDVPFSFPIQYIHGEKDEKFSTLGQQLRLRRPRVSVQALSGGHSLHITHPADVAEALVQFISR